MLRTVTRTVQPERVLGTVERQNWLDSAAGLIQRRFDAVMARLGRAARPVRDFLHGTWLGHPLHPVLTDLPLGAWTAAAVMDVMGLRRSARATIGIGIVGAVGAAAAGINDWTYTRGGTRRIGVMHALLNTAALSLYSVSFLQRLAGRNGAGAGTSAAGYLMVLASSYLGGEMVYRLGVQVDRNAWTEGPREFTPVMREADLQENRPTMVRAANVDLVLVRQDGRIFALENTCCHQGGPLAEGRLENGRIVCPWHGSTYDLATGRVIHGPSPFDQPRYDVRVRDGQVEVRLAPEAV